MAALPGFREIVLLSLSFLFINLCLQIHLISAQPITISCNNDIGNYTKNTDFHANLNAILSSVSSNINTTNGFYNGTSGDGVDQVNAIAYCRGDIDIESCRYCVDDAAQYVTTHCPNQKEAIVWLDLCMFRYSNSSILGIMSSKPVYYLYNLNNALSVYSYSSRLISLAGNLVNEAYNRSLRKFAGKKSSNPNARTVYGFMECTPDITPSDCKLCLDTIANYAAYCCYGYDGARLITPSCIYRFEVYPFLNMDLNQPQPLLPPPPPPQSSTTASTGKRSKSKTIIIVVCVIVASLVLTLITCVFFTKRRWKNTSKEPRLNEEEEGEYNDDFNGITQYNFA